MTERPPLVVDLHEIVPDPPDGLLRWEQVTAAQRNHRVRRTGVAVVGSVAAVAAVIAGAVLATGQSGRQAGEFGPVRTNGPILFEQLRPGPTDELVNTDLVTVNSDGSNLRPITDGPGAEEEAALAPDGRTVAYVEETGTPSGPHATAAHDEIHVVDIDGTDDRTLYSCTPTCLDLTWSPDGRKLAFADNGIRVLELDGSVTLVCGSGCGLALAQPAWSPDGSKLAFSQSGVLSDIGPAISPSAIFVVNSDGSDLHKLTNTACDTRPATCTVDTGPSWAPNGRSIAFSRFQPSRVVPGSAATNDSPRGLFLMRPDGSDQRELFPCPNQTCQGMGARWSPDGQHLALIVESEHPAAAVVDVATGQQITITPPATSGSEGGFNALTWSPDGTKLALSDYKQGGETGALYTVSSNGEDLVRLPTPNVYDEPPTLIWAPATGHPTASPEAATMPDITGMALSQATEVLGQHQLFIQVASGTINSAPAETVLTQTPAAGAPLPTSSNVVVTISAGPTPNQRRIRVGTCELTYFPPTDHPSPCVGGIIFVPVRPN